MKRILLCSVLAVAAALQARAQSRYKPDASTDPKAARLYAQSPETYIPENAYAPVWDSVDHGDVLWRKRVWRTIDLTNPDNNLLSAAVLGRNVAEVLLSGVHTTALRAYGSRHLWGDVISPSDPDHILEGFGAKGDQPMQKPGVSAGNVTALRIYEDWLYIASKQQLVVRIIGVAPVMPGDTKDGEVGKPAFWIYYPQARGYLAQQSVSSTASTGPHNLDEVFEMRRFAGKIEQVQNR